MAKDGKRTPRRWLAGLMLTLAVAEMLTAVATAAAEDRSVGTQGSVGVVMAMSATEVVLKGSTGIRRLAIDGATQMVVGAESRVHSIAVGDWVRDESVSDGQGGLRAVKLVMQRAAWQEMVSSE